MRALLYRGVEDVSFLNVFSVPYDVQGAPLPMYKSKVLLQKSGEV